MHTFFSSLGLVQRTALLCGGLCLVVSLVLATVGTLSSGHILRQQLQLQGEDMARVVAEKAATHLDEGDLLSMEVALRQALSQYQLQRISVYNLEARQIGAAGSPGTNPALHFQYPLSIDGNVAGKVIIELPEARWLHDHQRMSIGLVFLGLLASVFAAAVAAVLAQRPVRRLRSALGVLGADGDRDDTGGDEISALEKVLENLPIELIKSPDPAGSGLDEYETASLLYVKLHSFSHYVETLDESSLLRYTEFQRKLVSRCGQLYGAKLSVVRQFGLLLSFSGAHAEGNPALRACCAAWLVRALVRELQGHVRLRLELAMAIGLSEAGTGSSADIYPKLYNQHLIDELAGIVDLHLEEGTDREPCSILLSAAASDDEEVRANCRLGSVDSRHCHALEGFESHRSQRLKRQLELMQEQFGS